MPLWIIPVVIGGVLIANSFSWPFAILLGTFVVESCVILPLVSKRYGCKHCPQRDACPWLAHDSVGAAESGASALSR